MLPYRNKWVQCVALLAPINEWFLYVHVWVLPLPVSRTRDRIISIADNKTLGQLSKSPRASGFFFSKILRRTGAARCFGRKRHLSVKGISRKETRKDGGDVQYHGDGRLAVCVPFAFVPHRRIIMIICTDYVLRAITLLPGRKVSIRCMLNAVFDNVDIMWRRFPKVAARDPSGRIIISAARTRYDHVTRPR